MHLREWELFKSMKKEIEKQYHLIIPLPASVDSGQGRPEYKIGITGAVISIKIKTKSKEATISVGN